VRVADLSHVTSPGIALLEPSFITVFDWASNVNHRLALYCGRCQIAEMTGRIGFA